MELITQLQNRRSVRQYTGQPIPAEKLERVLQAGLLSASGRAVRPWEFIVVQNKQTLQALSQCRVGAAKMLENAACAIVVVADDCVTDVWVEDSSITMANMHLMADSEGLGSCWIQGRLRQAPDGRSTEDYLRDILGFPEGHKLLAILSVGMPLNHPEPYSLDALPLEKIHREHY